MKVTCIFADRGGMLKLNQSYNAILHLEEKKVLISLEELNEVIPIGISKSDLKKHSMGFDFNLFSYEFDSKFMSELLIKREKLILELKDYYLSNDRDFDFDTVLGDKNPHSPDFDDPDEVRWANITIGKILLLDEIFIKNMLLWEKTHN